VTYGSLPAQDERRGWFRDARWRSLLTTDEPPLAAQPPTSRRWLLNRRRAGPRSSTTDESGGRFFVRDPDGNVVNGHGHGNATGNR